MKSTSLSIIYYIKKSEPKKDGSFSIIGRITLNGADTTFYTKVDVMIDDWDAVNNIKTKNPRAKEIQSKLSIIDKKADEYYWVLYDRGEDPTAEDIKNVLTGVRQLDETLLSLFRRHNDELKSEVGKTIKKTTYKRYVLTCERLANYIKEKHHVTDFQMRQVTLLFIRGFEFYLRANFDVETNMVHRYMQLFKKIVRLAFQSGIMRTFPFADYKLKMDKVKVGHLNEAELKSIMSHIFPVKRLEQLRDIFVFSCFTGLSYADVSKLTKQEIAPYIGGKQWILTDRTKNNNLVNVPLFKIPEMILDKYDSSDTGKYALPVISNQNTNAYLKEIAALCGINKNLTFHMARHTFATTVTLCNGVPIEVVQKLLGHDDIRTTLIYAETVDTRVAHVMESLSPKLENYENIYAVQNTQPVKPAKYVQ